MTCATTRIPRSRWLLALTGARVPARSAMTSGSRVNRIAGNHTGNEPYGHDYLIAARNAQVSGGNAASFLTAF